MDYNLSAKEIHNWGKQFGIKIRRGRGIKNPESWLSKTYQNRVIKELKKRGIKPKISKSTQKIPSRSQIIYNKAKSLGFIKDKNIRWNKKENIEAAERFLYKKDIERIRREKREEFKFSKNIILDFLTFPPNGNGKIKIPLNLPIKSLLRIFKNKKISTRHKFLIGYITTTGEKYLTPSEKFLDQVRKLIENGITSNFLSQLEEIEEPGSDVELIIEYHKPRRHFIIESTPLYNEPEEGKRPKTTEVRNGDFFRYNLHPKYTSVFPKLQRYQIYSFDEEREEDENCLGHSIKIFENEGKIPEGTYDKFTKWYIQNKINGGVKTSEFSKLSELLKIYFHVVSPKNDWKNLHSYYPLIEKQTKGYPIIKLGLIDDHYFVYEEIDYSRYAAQNYHLHELKNWKYSFGTRRLPPSKKRPERKLAIVKYKKGEPIKYSNSYRLIKYFLRKNSEHPILIPLTYTELEHANEIAKNFTNKYKTTIDNTIPYFDDSDFQEHKTFTPELLSVYQGPPPPFNGKKNENGILIPNKYHIFSIDTETTSKKETYLEKYTLCTRDITNGFENSKPIPFKGKYCIENFLNYLPKGTWDEKLKKYNYENSRVLILAQNLGFDITFFMRVKGMRFTDIIKPSLSKVKSATAFYKGRHIVFRDTYSLTQLALRNFPEAFGLEEEGKLLSKEVMPYEAFTMETINLPCITTKLCLENLHSDEDRNQFIENVSKLKLFCDKDGKNHSSTPSDYIDHIEYSIWYCHLDVEIMSKGILKLRENFMKRFELDIFNFVSTPQIAEAAAHKAGVFTGVYKLSGFTREFISRCIYGGRVMTPCNKKVHLCEGDYLVQIDKDNIILKGVSLDDLDANSLYPSAMVRGDMCIPLGFPKVLLNLENTTIEDLKNYDAYYVKVNINNIPLEGYRQFPILSRQNESGIREYKNDLTGIHYLPKVQLEDVVKYHKLSPKDYTIIHGYFWENGSNNKLKEWIGGKDGLYYERLKYKNKKSPLYNPCLSSLIKLIMNALYGKTIMSPIDNTTHFIYSEEVRNKYVSSHYSTLLEAVDISENGEYRMSTIKRSKPIFKHATFAHIGANILSVSKRIMHEMMYIAEDIAGIDNYSMLYQDTDSSHIIRKYIPLLSEKYKEVYGRDLIGEDLGQFKSDFEFKNVLKSFDSHEFIGLGKKSYVDKVQCLSIIKGKEDEVKELMKTFNEEEKDKFLSKPTEDLTEYIFNYHIRMKGIPKAAILQKCQELNITPIELYKNLMYEIELEEERTRKKKNIPRNFGYHFNLLAGHRVSFKHSPDFRIFSEKEQTRFVSF